MKKFLVVLLSLGLIAAFGMTASAADVKFGGSYYVVGVYDNNSLLRPSETAYSRAYFFQRLRLQPEFKIAEGLTLTARIDAQEKQWGNSNWRTGLSDGMSSRASNYTLATATTTEVKQRIQENIEFERAYVTFLTGIGQFQVGYQSTGAWGTVYGDSEGTTGARIVYATQLGPVQLLAIYEKIYEAEQTAVIANQGKVDADNDNYALAAIYNAKGIEAGLLYRYYQYNSGLVATVGSGRTGTGAAVFNLLSPYMKATFGPVFVEGELGYLFGKVRKSETAGVSDVDLEAWYAYLHAKANVGPAYVGALYAFSSGDDGSNATKFKTNSGGGGTSFSPALMLLNDDFNTWAGNPYNSAGVFNSSPGATVSSAKLNTIIYKLYGGFNPTPKLNVEAGVIYATVDKVPAASTIQKKDLGTELDVTATYKIYDNLSYMVGGAYLWTGDWFKGNSTAARIGNDYMLMNRLSLSF